MRTSTSLVALAAVQLSQGLTGPRRGAARRGVVRQATYTINLQLPDGSKTSFPCADDEFVLDAAEENGIELPASCRSGACTSCQGRVLAGTFEHDDQSTLDDAALAAGYACTCVAYPSSDMTIVTHQMENFENGVMSFDDAPAVEAAAPPPPAETPAAAPAAEPAVAPAMSAKMAAKTLEMLRETVMGNPDLEAKCDEMAALLGAAAPAGKSVADYAVGDPDYVAHDSKETGYTIHLNKNNHRNSYYEYAPKKGK